MLRTLEGSSKYKTKLNYYENIPPYKTRQKKRCETWIAALQKTTTLVYRVAVETNTEGNTTHKNLQNAGVFAGW